MTENELDFLELIRVMLGIVEYSEKRFANTDWKAVHELAVKGKLYACLYDYAKQSEGINKELKKQWDVEKFRAFVSHKKQFYELIKILKALDEDNIKYMLFKGDVVAECYENPAYRVSCDSDVYVLEADFKRAHAVLDSSGYTLKPENSKKGEYHFENSDTGHVIELHTDIFGDFSSSHLDVLKSSGVGDIEQLQRVCIQGVEVSTLNPTNHLIYLMYHTIKHFMLEGGCIRFFTDITLFIKHNSGQIDINHFWKVIDMAGYGDFCTNLFNICVVYFGMEPLNMCGRKAQASEKIIKELIKDFIYGGDTEGIRMNQHRMMSVMTPYFVADKVKGNKVNFFRVLFPPYHVVAQGYKYVQKVPVLLPIGWIHRLFRNLFIMIKNKSDYSAKEEFEWVESRLDLMQNLGL